MANSTLALGSSLNLKSINKSVNSLGESVRKAQSSSATISKSLLESNRDKRKSLALGSNLFRKRREATLRREREDILEAGKVTGIVRRTGKVVMNSTKGFLGRILDYVGTLLVGWAILNLPKIIKLATNLTERMQKYFRILQDFVGGVSNFFLGLPQRFGEILTSITNFGFDNLKTTFDGYLDSMQTIFKRMQLQVSRFIIKLQSLDTPEKILDHLDMSIKDFEIPGLDKLKEMLGVETEETETETSTTNQTGSAGGGTRSSNPLLQLISGAEGGYDSMYPSEKYPQMLNMTMTELVAFQKLKLKDGRASAAVGAYQFLYPEQYVTLAGLTMNSKFTPENQDKLALAFLKARGITVEAFKRDRVGTALKLAQGFAGVPVLAPTQGKYRFVRRGESYYSGDGVNAATVSAERVEKSIDKLVGPTPSKPQQEPPPAQKVSFNPATQPNAARATMLASTPMEEETTNLLVINRTTRVAQPVARVPQQIKNNNGFTMVNSNVLQDLIDLKLA
jgi:hypothetical protein